MRAGWNARLAERLHRPDPAARIIAEAVVTEAEDVRQRFDQWKGLTSTVGVELLLDGGVKLFRNDDGPELEQAVSDGFEEDFAPNTTGFRVAQLVWPRGNPLREISRVQLHLVAQVSALEAQEVAEWKLTLFRIYRWGGSGVDLHIELQQMAEPARTAAIGGTAPGAVEFDFVSAAGSPRIGPDPLRPEGVGLVAGGFYSPTTLLILEALKSDGKAAANAGWGFDSAQSSVSQNGITLSTAILSRIQTGPAAGEYSHTLAGTGVPRLAIYGGGYEAREVGFDGAGNRIALPGISAASDIELVARGETPGDSSIEYSVSADLGTWFPYRDGDVVGAGGLSALPRQEFYYLRANLLPGGGGTISPVLRGLGAQALRRVDLDQLARVETDGWAVDPVELVGKITSATIVLLRDGPRDYRDIASELLSLYFTKELHFRVWVGHPDLDRADWLHLDSFLIDDYDAKGGSIRFFCLSALVLLKAALPVPTPASGGTVERKPLAYAPTAIPEVFAEIMDTVLTLPGRYRGEGIPESVTAVVSKSIEDSEAKVELDALSHLAGGGLISSQGRVKFADMLGGRTPVLTFPAEEITVRMVSPGLRQRVPEFFVPFSWSADEERYLQETRAFHAPSLLNIGSVGLDAPRRLSDPIARWIHTQELADEVGGRTVRTLGSGLMLWAFRSTYPNPHLEPGDVISVATDRFVAKDPTSTRPIKGVSWAVGVVQAVHDVWGREITIWIRSYVDILPSVELLERLFFRRSERDIRAVDLIESTSSARTYRVLLGAGVEEAHVYWVLFEGDLPDSYLTLLLHEDNLRATLLADGDTFTAPQPTEGQTLKGLVLPLAQGPEVGGEIPLEVVGDGIEFGQAGTPAPLDLLATFTRVSSSEERIDLVLTDPRGVVSQIVIYEYLRGTQTGPFAAEFTAGIYSHTYGLDPDHIRYLRVLALRNDGGDPFVRSYEADFNEVPGIPTVRRARIVDQEQLLVDGADTDTATLWFQEDVAGVLGPETQVDPRGSDPRFGAFTVVAGAAARTFRVFARNGAGVAGEYRLVIVEPYVPLQSARQVVREIPSESGNVATLTLVAVAGAVFDRVEFATKQGNGLWGGWVEDPSTPYAASVSQVEKHLSQIAYRVSDGADVLQEGVVSFDIGTIANVITATATPDGNGTANLRAVFDSDAAVGAGEAQYRVDGGAPVALTIAADRSTSWTLAQSTSAELLVEVQGQNAAGAWGPWYPVPVPIYVPTPTRTPRIVSAHAEIIENGLCGPAIYLENQVAVSFVDVEAGYTWELRRYENGTQTALVATGLALGTVTQDDEITGYVYDAFGAQVDVAYLVSVISPAPALATVDTRWTQSMDEPRTACP